MTYRPESQRIAELERELDEARNSAANWQREALRCADVYTARMDENAALRERIAALEAKREADLSGMVK